jgi:DNA-binding transcriptional regulator YdaS (Cro superfamily)
MSPFLERAVEIYGSQARLAARIGVSQAAISQARKRGIVSQRLATAIVRDSNGVLDLPVSEWLTASTTK